MHIGYQRRLMRSSISTTLYRYCGWQLSDCDDGCCATDTESARQQGWYTRIAPLDPRLHCCRVYMLDGNALAIDTAQV